jgi:hypothetical protein
MVQDLSQQVDSKSAAGSNSQPTVHRQAVAGLMPPELGEAMIREAFPAVVDRMGWLARAGKGLVRTVFAAPFGFALLAIPFLLKFAPFICKRYTLTNKRLMVRRGWKPKPRQEIPLADIDEVRYDPTSADSYFRSGTLEVLGKGEVRLRLTNVPEPEGFRQAVLNAVKAWVPEKAKGPFLPASAPVKA